MMAGGWLYRVGQVRAARRAVMSEADRAEASAHLAPPLAELFLRMPIRDQAHALRVMRRVDSSEPLLCQAALLHDVGKIESPLGTPGRSLVVLANATGTTDLVVRLPGIGPRIRRYIDHPRLGADLLRAAGADAPLVQIVAEHESREPSHPQTAVLQSVDERE